MPFEIDERWIELAYGELRGRCRTSSVPSEVVGALARATRRSCRRAASRWSTLDLRVRAACVELAERAPRPDVVGRVATCRRSRRRSAWALGVGIDIAWRSHLSQASICRIDIRRAGPILYTFNETALPG